MAKSKPTLKLSTSRDIPFDKLVLSQSNVRRIKAGLSIEELAEDVARRTLLQSLAGRAWVSHRTGNNTTPSADACSAFHSLIASVTACRSSVRSDGDAISTR